MAKGKKTDKETVYKIMISMFTTNNFADTAKMLNIPPTTVEAIYKRNKDKEEFVELCAKKEEEFVNTATRIINKANKLLERRIDTASDSQDELEAIIEEIFKIDKSECNETKKKTLVNKITKLQLNNLSELTTAIGTLYDKRALAKGDSTVNNSITVNFSEEVKGLAE